MEQLEDKDLKLRVLSDEQNKQVKMKEMSREKSRVQVATVKRQLQRERVLKMDAYQRVDELQTQVTRDLARNEEFSDIAVINFVYSSKKKQLSVGGGSCGENFEISHTIDM